MMSPGLLVGGHVTDIISPLGVVMMKIPPGTTPLGIVAAKGTTWMFGTTATVWSSESGDMCRAARVDESRLGPHTSWALFTTCP